MEWVGVIALILILCYSSYPSKVKKLERKVKLLEKKLKGENKMSDLIKSLINKECEISFEDEFTPLVRCTVLDVDDEWVKIGVKDKKENIKTKLIRIDGIKKVEIISE